MDFFFFWPPSIGLIMIAASLQPVPPGALKLPARSSLNVPLSYLVQMINCSYIPVVIRVAAVVFKVMSFERATTVSPASCNLCTGPAASTPESLPATCPDHRAELLCPAAYFHLVIVIVVVIIESLPHHSPLLSSKGLRFLVDGLSSLFLL